jgi:hypothetical protein
MRRYFSLLLAGFFGAIPLAGAAASPMEFGLAMTFGYDGVETPHPILTGAHLGIIYRWDFTSLTPTSDESGGPLYDWLTSWPTSNTTAVATISGIGPNDGEYPATVSHAGEWRFFDNVADEDGRDEVQFPNVEFAFNGGTVEVIAPRVLFLDLFRQASNPITPQKFNRFSGRGISTPEFWTTDPDRHGEFANVIAWAITVPEPSAFAVAATSLFAVSAIRRRR